MHLHFYGIKLPSHSESSYWSRRFIEWLKTIQFSHSPARDYLDLCVDELEQGRKRLLAVIRQLRQYSQQPEINKIICLLLTVPGIGFTIAITLYTELINAILSKCTT